MPITVVGSIAYDAVKTPFGERERMLGGAAVHFALAASFFEEVLAVPVGTVRSRLHRAKARLADWLSVEMTSAERKRG